MADYSTTIDVFQSQVGKSGDVLLKFEHKNGGERETPRFLSKQLENKQDNLFLILPFLCFTLCTTFCFELI